MNDCMTNESKQSDGSNMKLKTILGPGKAFMDKQLPTNRSVIQKALLEKEKIILKNGLHFSQVHITYQCNSLRLASSIRSVTGPKS